MPGAEEQGDSGKDWDCSNELKVNTSDSQVSRLDALCCRTQPETECVYSNSVPKRLFCAKGGDGL